MSGVKISALPAANAANDTDQLEVNQSGVSRRLTVGQIATTVAVVAAVGVVYPVNFGAIGNGIADDTAAVQAAIAAAAGKILDGAGLVYRITASLTGIASNTTVRNMTLDFSDMPLAAGFKCFQVNGTLGAAVALTANVLAGASVVTVGSTASFAVGQLVFLTSNAIWETQTNTTHGQYGRIKSVDSATQLTLADEVLIAFRTAAVAAIAPVSPVNSVSFQQVTFLGADDIALTQSALHSSYSQNLRVVDCSFVGFDYNDIALFRCYKPVVHRCRMQRGVSTGTAYGVGVFGGTYAATISDCHGEDLRHTVTLGDIVGINLYTLVTGCHAINSKDAGFDSHPASMYTTFANNHVEMSALETGSSSHNGLNSEGANMTIIGNTVIGAKGAGIAWSPAIADPLVKATAIISGNTVVLDEAGYAVFIVSSTGIYAILNNNFGGNIDRLVIANNTISGGLNNPRTSVGLRVRNNYASATIANVTVTGNHIGNISSTGIEINAAAGTIDGLTISNNTVDTPTGTNALYLLADVAATSISNVTGSGNILKAVSNGLRLSATAGTISNVTFGKNITKSPTTNTLTPTGNVNNAIFDDADSAPTTAFTGTPATLIRRTNWYTFGSAGTPQIVNLPAPATNQGYEINLLNNVAQTVSSASSNVVPRVGGAAGTAILSATAGAWVVLRSDGTNWRIVKAN